MKFATIGHFLVEENINMFPKSWVKGNLIVSPEMNVNGTRGYISAVALTAQQMINMPIDKVREIILENILYLQDELVVDLVQLGALTTSFTEGGKWIAEQKEFKGYVNHGDSYTSAVTCQAVHRLLKNFHRDPSKEVLSVVGAYGIIGEAVSRILVPQFAHSILIGRRKNKLEELGAKIPGDFETNIDLKTERADIIITATNHPTALLHSGNLKEKVLVIDVSQPPNLSIEVCRQRPDIFRIDGGYVDFPFETPIPGMPIGKIFACIAEVIMQAMENDRSNHVGSIDQGYLRKTERWGEKYGFKLNELTNFGRTIKNPQLGG
jgi:predicted amino acid dehydrogenase